MLGKVSLEILDDAATRRAHPKDGRECEREVRAVFGEDEFGRLLVQPTVDYAHELGVVFLAHECRGVAADLPCAGAQINVVVSVERESMGAELVEIRFLPIDEHVDDVFHEHDLIDLVAEDLRLFLFAFFFVASHRIAEALDVIEYLMMVAHVPMDVAQLLEHDVVPDGDDVPVFVSLGPGIVVPDAALGNQDRGWDLEYLI